MDLRYMALQKEFEMRRYAGLSILIIALMLVGWTWKSTDELLLGTWKFTFYVPAEEAAKMSEEPLPEGLRMELSGSGRMTFHRGGKANSEGEFTLRLIAQGQELPLRFLIRDAGEWKVHGDTLVETSADSAVVPLDDLTKSVVRQSPEFQAMMTPVKGESSSTKIIHITEDMAEMELLDPPFYKLTMRKVK